MSEDRGGALFGAKRLAARAVGAASRASGRGGGTTLPGRLLLRLDPRAIARLGSRLDRGVTLISATNGKTTTAGMLAALLAADGRAPVHNRAGSNMTWGIATALLEQRGREGLFEVDEAWLPRVAAELDPSLVVLGNLFRDQLDRYGETEALADEWAKTVAERSRPHPLRPQRRRPAGRRPRPRRRGRAARGRRLLRHRRRGAGAARAAARLRRQALPPLRPSLRLRARLRRPPRSLLLPQLRRGPARRRRRGDADRAARHARLLARPCARPPASWRSSCRCPASTTSTTPWPRSPPRSSWASRRSGSRRRWPRCAAPSAGSRRSRSAPSGSRSCWSRTRPGPTRSCAR